MPARIVIDTNTFLSAAIRSGSTPSLAVSKALLLGIVLTSTDTWEELQDVLLRVKFERYKAVDVRRSFLETLEAQLEPVSVHSKLNVCRHPRDDKFLALAIDGHAGVIITGDDDLLVLHPFQNVAILSPAEYLSSAAL